MPKNQKLRTIVALKSLEKARSISDSLKFKYPYVIDELFERAEKMLLAGRFAEARRIAKFGLKIFWTEYTEYLVSGTNNSFVI